MTTVTRHALRVYAALSGLKANNQNGDVLDALIPFLEPVLAAMHGTIFDGRLLSLGVQKIYGWRFNKDVAEGFTGRLLAKGYLARQAGAVFTVSFQPPARCWSASSMISSSSRRRSPISSNSHWIASA